MSTLKRCSQARVRAFVASGTKKRKFSAHSVIVHRLLHLCSKMKWQLLDCVFCALSSQRESGTNFFHFAVTARPSFLLALPSPQGKGNNFISSRALRSRKQSLVLQLKHDTTKGSDRRKNYNLFNLNIREGTEVNVFIREWCLRNRRRQSVTGLSGKAKSYSRRRRRRRTGDGSQAVLDKQAAGNWDDKKGSKWGFIRWRLNEPTPDRKPQPLCVEKRHPKLRKMFLFKPPIDTRSFLNLKS